MQLSEEEYREGQILLIDKPLEWSSFQVVKLIKTRLKYKLGIKKIKVGHAGTLDPLATGLLVIAIGRKTKSIPELMADEKVYTGEIFLGATRPSIDKESEIDQTYSIDHIEDADIKALEHKLSLIHI